MNVVVQTDSLRSYFQHVLVKDRGAQCTLSPLCFQSLMLFLRCVQGCHNKWLKYLHFNVTNYFNFVVAELLSYVLENVILNYI